jgi:hypothetical protein
MAAGFDPPRYPDSTLFSAALTQVHSCGRGCIYPGRTPLQPPSWVRPRAPSQAHEDFDSFPVACARSFRRTCGPRRRRHGLQMSVRASRRLREVIGDGTLPRALAPSACKTATGAPTTRAVCPLGRLARTGERLGFICRQHKTHRRTTIVVTHVCSRQVAFEPDDTLQFLQSAVSRYIKVSAESRVLTYLGSVQVCRLERKKLFVVAENRWAA